MDDRERASILGELSPPFAIHAPARQRVPLVFCSPHSGRVYPRAFIESSRLDSLTLRKSEDCYIDELFSFVADCGAPLLAAHFPRAYLDVNREPYELDPELFREKLPDFANSQSVRVVGGLGTIARVVADSEEIYRSRLPLAAAFARIEHLYKPFHEALGRLIAATQATFGAAVLIDCHSMPSSTSAQSGPRPDIVLGDRFGTSCDGRLTRHVRDLLAADGFQVQLNRPYAGGFITEHYGRPERGVHALQIEINRAIYLDERSLTKSAGFEALRARLAALVRRLIVELPLEPPHRQAAE